MNNSFILRKKYLETRCIMRKVQTNLNYFLLVIQKSFYYYFFLSATSKSAVSHIGGKQDIKGWKSKI